MVSAVRAVGVDNGGTWIRMKGLGKSGRCVWSVQKPSPTLERLPVFLKKNLQRFHGKLVTLAVGSRGMWKSAKRRALQRALRGLAANIIVISDVEAAWRAAFGEEEGIIVISGTGSIAYGRTSDGRFARAGGLGPDQGDEGSGYWIGKEWLRRSEAAVKGGQGVRRAAALTPRVIRKAQKGNWIAGKIISEAQSHLAELAVRLIRKLKLKGRAPLSVSGSVLENDWFRSGFIKSLRKRNVGFQLIPKRTDPAIAPLAKRSKNLRFCDTEKPRHRQF